ncbi:hypothetical protein CBM2623_A80264 [Cupriavidus taiwanensis]|nr:hypothetical protein CBM2623_A80264 [Cupriavidus taiwanensis]
MYPAHCATQLVRTGGRAGRLAPCQGRKLWPFVVRERCSAAFHTEPSAGAQRLRSASH